VLGNVIVSGYDTYDRINKFSVNILFFHNLQNGFAGRIWPAGRSLEIPAVAYQILFNKLYHYGNRGVANDRLRRYLKNRKQFGVVNQQRSNLNTIKCSVPQGSTLGPMLFLIFNNIFPAITTCKSYLFTGPLLSHNNRAQMELN